MNIIDFEPAHILQIEPQASQRYIDRSIKYGEYLAAGDCFTGMQDGRVVAIGGVIPVSETRAYLHMIVAEGFAHQWIKIFRATRRLITAVQGDYLRLETLSTTPESDRWLEMVGFQYEGVLRRVMPDGTDAKSYSIVRT
ncbi:MULTISPECIES: hypothetical protein [unclassified Pantoea]|uniref:hypothetical protein n=1 Tax=unclassified Pantoea TaxID=2630326 RepID=UPI0012319F2B|nr:MULTISPECIES: hypothetical protein [unclassified Pantoea]KAA5932323.1 hypothetical protein F3I59_04655 [Pantoea sp. VH_8]KAA5937384.1 hypothetical protein F3I58_04685 [Pantoea sp. VH_4]